MIVERLLRVALVGSAWVLYLLIGLSILSFAAMAERWLFFRRNQDDVGRLRDKLLEAFEREDMSRVKDLLDASRAIEAKVLRAGARWAHGGPEAVADAIESESCRLRGDLERGSTLLGTLGNNAPFVGLLGTVLGVIQAFHQLDGGANKAAMGNVMGGISEALVATGVGLVVALPAVVAYNLVQRRIGEIETNVAGLAKLFTAYLKTREHFERSATAELAAKELGAKEIERAPIAHSDRAYANGAPIAEG